MQRPPRSRATTQYTFQRAYKACIACRNRKVKCEAEPDPHRPCKRCRKMRLECRFSAKQPWSRTKGDEENGTTEAVGGHGQIGDRNGSSASGHGGRATVDNKESPLTTTSSGLEDGGCISTTVLQKQVASGNDALDILFTAAAQAGPGGRAGVHQSTAEEMASPFDVRSKENVLKIWEGCRFVKMGWFSAEEALLYTDWFFQNLVPATTPILTDFFASHHKHYWLITQEPVLCCTILMIAARYHTLPGPSGTSRGFYIHNRLWQHCQHLILRIMLGQEKLSKAKTRHLSSIEALLLLSEWYPLALHFPLESDGWDSDWMLTTLTMRDPPPYSQESPMQDRWREDVVEPTKRLDRMSWMLVSSALALAHELGLFDPRDHMSAPREEGIIAGPDVENYLQDLELRRRRLPSLLFVITNLLASRIGCTSIMPELSKQSSLDRLMAVDPEWARFMTSWVNLTGLTRNLRESFLVKSKCDNPRIDFESLEQWKVQLAAWKDHHQGVDTSRYDNILLVEYQYLRVLANSLGVQGIVERVLSETHPQGTIDATFVSEARQLNMSRAEYEFIEEVIDGACVILARIVSLSDPRCLPMRDLSRVISSSIFLLKALALGVRKTKLQESLHLLDAAIAALLSNPLDDIHLVSRYAILLKTHVSRLRQTFASSSRVEYQNNGPDQAELRGIDEQEQLSQTVGAWDPDMIDWTGQADFGDWLSLPLDPLMAPFGPWDGAQAGLGLDLDCLDLDFIWNLPP
ncbi:transcription factor domain-containing protein [Aspergillus undulatus]|uniref:transcription factor domain-containing protein n=1 Tax=Aspergillus undulatus TaxID=1810928 RepID=UPI003CCD7A41